VLATIALVDALTFNQARACVLAKVGQLKPELATEEVSLFESVGRVLAEPILADRDLPPVARSVRDGFAVRAADLPGELTIIGEVRAGDSFAGEVQPCQAVEIMTGAPMPRGSDSVAMIEHASVAGDRITIPRALQPGDNVSAQACQAARGEILIAPGKRLGFADIALTASVGCSRVLVYARPQVALLATGDEIVEVTQTPLPFQVRNSNVEALAVQVARAGAIPRILPVARDLYAATRELVEHGLRFDMLPESTTWSRKFWRIWAPSFSSIAS